MTIRTAVLATFVAIASSAATTAQAEESPKWTLGAGLGNVTTFVLPSPNGSLGGLAVLGFASGDSVPVATFFVERRLGDRTWLVFGAAGSVSRTRVDPSPTTGATVPTKFDSEQVSLSAGLRRVVTRPGAPVEVSLQGTVEGGYLHDQQELTTTGAVATTEIRDTGGFGMVTGGIALERVLTGDLALRISTPLLGGSWAKLEVKDGAGSHDATSARVFVVLAPRIELRLAF